MKNIIIEGNHELSGEIQISGAKNSAVALMPAAILSDETSTIYNIPNISDVNALKDILEFLGCDITHQKDMIKIDTTNLTNKTIPESLSSKLRASYYFMGALLGKYGHAEIFCPGGCNIGTRPINFHIKGFEKMGATCQIKDNKYILTAKTLKGARIYLDFASVGATINFMLAGVKAEGTTIINNAAKEPEIVNIATFLNNMGAKIIGAGTNEIKIIGVKHLHSASIEVIPDRIEAGTYLIIGCLLGKNLTINGVIIQHLEALISKLREIGVKFAINENKILIESHPKSLNPVNIKTLVYPGFPTDLGQLITTLLTQCNGTSIFEETIYENRIGHIKYLNLMGANIETSNQNSIIIGPTPLYGRKVISTDLRGGASMIVAALIASGTTHISDVEHILRGYEGIVEKLKNVGAKIELTEIE